MTKSATRHAVVVATVVAVCIVALGLWLHGPAPVPAPIASSGGAPLDLPARKDGAHYRQEDPRWAEDTIGGSGQPLAAVGCTVSAVAMASSHLGCDITPKELNADLIRSSIVPELKAGILFE